jgi:hypothetical protein
LHLFSSVEGRRKIGLAGGAPTRVWRKALVARQGSRRKESEGFVYLLDLEGDENKKKAVEEGQEYTQLEGWVCVFWLPQRRIGCDSRPPPLREKKVCTALLFVVD